MAKSPFDSGQRPESTKLAFQARPQTRNSPGFPVSAPGIHQNINTKGHVRLDMTFFFYLH